MSITGFGVKDPSVVQPPPPLLDYPRPDLRQDAGEDPTWNSLPVVGEPGPGKSQWHLVVSHSPFLLKRGLVWAADADEAKTAFLQRCKRLHADRAEQAAARDRRQGVEGDPSRNAVLLQFDRALRASEKGELQWSVRPAGEVQAERAEYFERTAKLRDEHRGSSDIIEALKQLLGPAVQPSGPPPVPGPRPPRGGA